MSSLFRDALPQGCSKLYETMHGPKGDKFDGLCEIAREHCDDLWSDFQPFADQHFSREFPIRTHERWFEMYLTVSLIRAGHQIDCPKPGPDILLEVDGRRIWVEAVCATSGKQGLPDSVQKQQIGQVLPEPTDQYVLRIRNSLEAKQKKYLRYIKNGIVACGDVVVVAINIYQVYGYDPYIEDHMKRSLYGIGDVVVRFDKSTQSVSGDGHQQVVEIRKSSGAGVGVQPFTDNSIEHVSAVLASHASAFNQPPQLGGDLVSYPNLTAENAWPAGVLQLGSEWRFEEHQDRWEGVLVKNIDKY